MENVMSKETRRIGKRTLAMFMAIVMCLSLLPVNALASSDTVELVVGETVKLPGVAWSDNEKHEWHVGDESIVAVNDGFVTGLSAGETTVTHVYYEEIMDEESVVEEPEAPAEEPEAPAEEPEAPAEEPEAPAEEPEAPAEEPEAPAEEPEAPAEEPEAPAEEPEAPAEEPEAPAEEPEAPAEEPEAPAEESEAPAEEPVDLGTESLILNDPAEEPEVPAEEPEAPAEEPEAPAEEPEAPAEKPEAPAEEPEAPAEESEAPAEEPEAPAEESEAPAEEPEAPAEEPVIVEIDGYERREESWTIIVREPDGISGKATHEGVTVTVNAPYGAFPEGTELNIAPVEKEKPSLEEQIFNFFDKLFGNAAEMVESAEEIEDPMEAVRSLLTETFEEIEEESNMVAFDITFTDPATGEELQPADGKTVDVEFTVAEDSALLADGPAALQVYHIGDDGAETIGEEVLAMADGDVTLAVEAESFSIYVVNATARTITGTTTIQVGESVTLQSDSGIRSHSWSSSDSAIVSVASSNSNSTTITGVAPGSATITHRYRNSNSNNAQYYSDTIVITVEAPEGYVPVTVNVKYGSNSNANGATVVLKDAEGNTYRGITNSSGVASIWVPAYGEYDISASYTRNNTTYAYSGEYNFTKDATSTTITLAQQQTYAHLNIRMATAGDETGTLTISSIANDLVIAETNGITQNVELSQPRDYEWDGSVKPTMDTVFTFTANMSDGTTLNIVLDKDDTYPVGSYYESDPGSSLTEEDDDETEGHTNLYNYGIPYESGRFDFSGYTLFEIASVICGSASINSNGEFTKTGGLDFVLNISSIIENATNVVQGTKVLEGRDMVAGEFQFKVTQTDANWQPLEGKEPVYTTNGEDGAINKFFFDAITYTANGTYYYTVEEVNRGAANMVYDTAVFRVTHTVTSTTTTNNGNTVYTYTVTPTIVKVKDGVSTTVDAITFDNTYNPAGSLKVNKTVTVDGQAPASDYSVTVGVYAADNDQTALHSATLNAANGWTHTFPTVDAGSYVVKETVNNAPSSEDYTVSEEGSEAVTVVSGQTAEVTLVNTYVSKIDVDVTKAWNDAENQDGIRPAGVTVKLFADNVDTGKTLVLNADNSWSGSFTKLDRNNASGQAIAYTVDEVAVANYTKAITGNMTDGFTITNSYTPATRSITVRKVWDDVSNHDGIRPASIDVQLYAGDTASGAAVTLNEANGWTYTWSGLAKKANGVDITYTVDETAVPTGYTKAPVAGDMDSGYTITNSHTPKTSVSVTKVWDDAGNQDGKRPASIQVQLYADGEPVGDPVTLSTTLTHTWNNLTKFADGVEIAYTVDEVAVPAEYTKAITGNAEDGFVITNSYTPEETAVSVEKVWNDADDQDGIRPDSVSVQLYAGGTASGAAVTLNEANGWTYTWNGLAKKANGADIAYTVDEVAVPEEYTKSVTGSMTDGFTITNSHTPAETSVTVTKVWDDANNQDGIRPDSVQVQLKADGEPVGDPVTLDVTLTYTWNNLPVNKAGQAIAYTVDEVAVPAEYTKAITGNAADGFVITNTHAPAKTEVTITKVWEDNRDEAGIRPASINVQLYANGNASGDPVALNEANGWSYTWTELDQFAGGVEIQYTADETAVPTGYEKTSVTGSMANGFTVTNTLKRTGFTVVKVDAANINSKLEGAVFTLTNDGNGETYTATSDANGEAVFENIPYGTYTLVETTAPTHYVKSETQWTVVIGDNGVAISKKATAVQKLASFFSAGSDDFTISGSTLTVENTHETGTFTIAKTATVDGAANTGTYTFGIYTMSVQDGQNVYTLVDTVEVTGGSSVVSEALDTQVTYYIKETAMNPGITEANYDLAVSYSGTANSDGYVPVLLNTTDTVNFSCTNTYTIKTGSLTVKKLVEKTTTDEAFTIQVKLGDGSVAASGTEYTANGLYTFQLKHNETATITGIPYTTAYAVTEQYTEPFGYVVTYSNATGSIAAAESTATVTNSFVTSGFVVNKIDKDSKAGLPGAQFTLYTTYDVNDASNNVVYGVYTTGEGGSLTISNLPAGIYWLKETDAPDNYDITDETVWKITVTASQTTNTGSAIKVEKDNTGKNFVATLYNTIVSFFGTKTYSVDPVTIKAAQTDEEKTAVLTVENTKIDYSLTISKSVTGAETTRSYKFNVYAATASGEKGALIAENVEVAAGSSVTLSNKPANGEISAPKLVAGSYIVEEVTSDVAVANYTWTGVTFDSSTAELTEAQRTDSVAAVNSYTRDMATLVVTKTYSGPADLAENFRITVTDGTTPVTAGLTDATKNDDGSYTWTFPVLTNVAYSVSESNYDQVGDWSWTSGTVSGSATVTEKNGSETVALNNVYAHDQAGLTITKDVTGVLSESNVGRTFEFKVYKAGDRTTEIATVTLPENGSWSKTISVDNNTSYEIVETDGAVSGYVWTVASKTVGADVPVTGSATAAFTNNYEKDFNDDNDVIIGDSFSISKIDDSDNALAGAEFVLTDGSTEIWNGTSDSNGAVTVVIENSDITNAKAETGATKTYTLTETAPEGYVGAGPWTVTLTCDKAESEQQAVSGKFYHIYTWTVTSVTDASGEQLGEGGITVVNDLIMGTITVNKVVSGLPEDVKNANEYTFSVYNDNGALVDTLTVNADSDWADTTVSLPYGEYTIEESNPGNETGYTWSGVRFDKQTVSIASQGQQIGVTATNTYTRDLGDLTVSKTVEIDALAADKVSGKTYELTITGPADANGEYSNVAFENGVATVTLTDGESITIENLPTGDYTVTEGDAKVDGLILAVTGSVNGGDAAVADEGLEVSVSKDAESSVAVTNTYTLGSDQDTARFTISKKNSDTNAAISDVVFTLYSDADCTVAVDGMTKTTDDKGQAEFALGDELLGDTGSATFYLKETVPAGYVDNGTKWQIEINKTDASGNYSVELSRIESGLFYKLYHWFVSIVNKDAVWEENTLVISNEPIDYTINVVKVDENGAALAGSAFSLNGTAMEAVSGTDNRFTATVNYTVTPQLTVSETTVPTGYTGVADFGLEFVVEEGVVTDLIETEDSESVTIEKNGDIYTVIVENVRRPDGPDATDDTAEFDISKVETDNTANGLAGAQFALLTADEYAKYENGETYTALRTATSDENGKVEITELVTVDDEGESTYYLIETAAPTGFTADNSVWTVTVAKTANDPVYEGSADEGKWIVHKSYAVTDIQLDGQSVLSEGAVEISNKRNSYTVTVTKSFSGRAALPEGFQIVNNYDDTVFTVANAASGDGIETPYTWTMEIPFDTAVTFTEERYNDEETSGYSVAAVIADNSGAAADGAVTIPANNDTTVAFTNTYDKVFDPANDDINGTGFSISKTGDYEDGFLAGAQFTLTDENGKSVWTGTTADGLLEVVIEGIDVVDPKEINAEGETIRTYTLTETAPTGYTGAGPWTVTISGKESVSEDLKENKFYHIYDWTVESVTLAGETENLLADGVISILNTRDYGTLTITKTVKGLVSAEARAEHTFSINVANGSEISNTYDVTVTGNDTVSYAETITLPTGAYSVKELEALIGEHSGPAVTYKVNDEAVEAENGQIAIEIVKGAETAVEVTNEYSYDPDQHTVTVNVTKVWEDDNDRDAIRPDSIRVELKDAEGTVIGTQDIGADGVATFEFDPYYNEYKKDYVVTEIGYTVDGEYVEGAVPGYTTEVDGYTVTNTHEVETIDIYVAKTWKDNGKREVTFRLLADGVRVATMVLDGEIDEVEFEEWKGIFENMPKNDQGEAIEYTLTEDELGSSWKYSLRTFVKDNGDITFHVRNYKVNEGEEEEEDDIIIDIPDDDIPTTDIPEEDVPAAEPPKTSDSMIVWVLAAAVSGLGLVWLTLDGKKRKEEENI